MIFKSMMVALFACGLLAAHCFAQSASADESAFGITLGKPLTVKACPKGQYGIALPTNFMCVMPVAPIRRPWGATLTPVCFPSAIQPDFVGGCVVTSMLDGRVEGIGFDIPTLNDQDRAFSELKSKYGEPLHIDKVVLQNAFGAQFQAYQAEWKFTDFRVTFDGAKTIENEQAAERAHAPMPVGYAVLISSPKLDAALDAWAKRQKAAEPKL